jgi:hypothetical protein
LFTGVLGDYASIMRIFAVLFGLVCALSGADATTDTALQRSAAAAAAVPEVRIQFTQTKELAILDRPLVSTGSMEIDRPHARLRWQFDRGATLILADGRLRRWGADGREEDLGRDPSAQAMLGQMRGFLQGDWAALGELFTLTSDHERIHGVPRTAGLKRYLSALMIAVDGAGAPTELVLTAPEGDITTYRFAAPDRDWKADPNRFLGP